MTERSDAAEHAAQLPKLDGDGSVSTQIIHTLTEYFFSGEFSSGSKLPSERQLAASLGVSRAAVREAVQSLGLLGVVEIRQGDGTYLRSSGSDILPRVIEWGLFLGEQRVTDLVEARQHVEHSLAGLAARRRTDDELAELRRLVERMDTAASVDEFIDLDVEFHSSVARCSHNSALSGMLTNITSLLRVWMGRALRLPDQLERANAEHRAILDAIAAQDSRGAQSAMRKHLTNAERRLRRALTTRPGVAQ
jgi:GntR family transcriptional repressor for pyruvate dehydrogenase complex